MDEKKTQQQKRSVPIVWLKGAKFIQFYRRQFTMANRICVECGRTTAQWNAFGKQVIFIYTNTPTYTQLVQQPYTSYIHNGSKHNNPLALKINFRIYCKNRVRNECMKEREWAKKDRTKCVQLMVLYS